MDKKPDCACVADDARACFMIRYYDTASVDWDDQLDHEKCQCPCHGEREEDVEDEDD